MRFIWDDAKRRSNLVKHRLDFRDAETVFTGPTFTFQDTRKQYDEDRWVTVGLLADQLVVIVHTETDETIRIISMRKGTRYEQVLYFENL